MASLDEIRTTRLAKIELLKSAGFNPYPISVPRDMPLADARANFVEIEKKGEPVSFSGRIMAIRGQGSILFVVLEDGTEHFQSVFKKDSLSLKLFELFTSTVDIGDLISVTGKLFVTQRGEKSILADSWLMAAKSLRPLPEKWHGLQDIEERFRHRYLDSLMSLEVRERFVIRSKMISEIRQILDKAGYLEVDTPVLQPMAGGASAEPFKTHHEALNIDLFLRIAPELYLKKMLVGGFPKVYEIARNFRNEGIDLTHNPEFTMLEFYEAYSNASRQMVFVEDMFKQLVHKLFGNYKLGVVDFSQKFSVISFYDLLNQHSPLKDASKTTIAEAEKIAIDLGIGSEKGPTLPKLLDAIYKKTCRPKIVQPTFVINYPLEYLPLAKRSLDNPKTVDAFQLIVDGIEIVKAFSELNDPIDQAERFNKQDINKKMGDKEAQSTDEEFLEAMEYGMPPAGGVGIGLDRLLMLLTNTKNIKEVIYFPTMKTRLN